MQSNPKVEYDHTSFDEYVPDPKAHLPMGPVVVWQGVYLDKDREVQTGRIVLDPDVDWAGKPVMDSHPLVGDEYYDDIALHGPKARIEVLFRDAMDQESWVRTRNIEALWGIVTAYVLAAEARNMARPVVGTLIEPTGRPFDSGGLRADQV